MKTEMDADHCGMLESSKSWYWALAGIAAFALGIRLVGLNKGIWLDEAALLHGVLGRSVFDTLRFLRGMDHPPLMFVLLNLWSRIGAAEIFLRIPSVIFGIGTVVAAALWMRSYSPAAGILAGICAATTPIFLRYSQEIHGYPLLLFATALAFLFASRVASRPEQAFGYVALAFSLAAAVSSHLAGIMLVLPVCAFIAISTRDRKSLRWDGALLAVGLPCLIFAFIWFLFLHNIGVVKRTWWMPPISAKLAATMSGSLFGVATLSWLATPFQSQTPVLALCLERVAQCLALAWMALLLARGDWRRTFPFLAAALIYWAEIIGYSILDTPIFYDRILLPSMVPLLGFAALSIATIREAPLKRASMIFLILLALCFSAKWIVAEARMPREGWREAAGVLASQRRPNDPVVFYPPYGAIPVWFYLPSLSSRATTQIPIDGEPALEEKLDHNLADLEKEGKASAIFLVLRPEDELVLADPVTFHRLLSALAAKGAGRSLAVKVIAVWALPATGRPGAEHRDALTASLESAFGPPASAQDGELFTMFEYQPRGSK